MQVRAFERYIPFSKNCILLNIWQQDHFLSLVSHQDSLTHSSRMEFPTIIN